MVLTVDSDTRKIIATLHTDDGPEKFECEISACQNPVCTCETASLDFIPLENGSERQQFTRNIKIDLDKRCLEYQEKNNLSKEELEFYNLLLKELDENDFKIFYNKHLEYKKEITEKADIDSIDAHFDYDEVEYSGLMYAYNDVLPYGSQLNFTLNGMKCIVLDQYCLLPHCSCTETTLNIFSTDEIGKTFEEICTILLKYKKKKWEIIEKCSLSSNLNDIRSAIETQYPNIYNILQKRHEKLKNIYKHCKKRHYAKKQRFISSKVDRNDPCPCGSGLKYKKCCLKRPK